MKAIGNILAQRDPLAEGGVSTLTTKAKCLTCGRESIARVQAVAHVQSPVFPNALVNQSSPGPDVLRGGFKLPVNKPLTGDSLMASQFEYADDADVKKSPRAKTSGRFL